MSAPWMLARLTYATQGLRAVVDEAWIAPLEEPTRAKYRTFLATVYSFQVPFEAALAQTSLPVSFLRARLRAGRIASDLIALGIGPAESELLARPFPMPELDEADALGWLFVADQPMLYAHQVYTHLSHKLPVDLARAHAYLTSYAGVTSVRWNELGIALDRIAAKSPETPDQIVRAARFALATLVRWLGELPEPEAVPIAS
jgi:heme oxygenase